MVSSVTVSVESYRWPERVLNAVATASLRLNLPPTRLNIDEILSAARRRTGLTDWGDDRFIEVMRVLVDILDDAGITPLARAICRNILTKSVVNRLRIEAWMAKHPEAEDIEIERPLFVVGFPRTGTTVLQNLLSLPDDRRALEFWELTDPVPRFDDAAEDERRRVRATDRMLSAAYLVAPEMGAVHEVRARTPEECWGLMANTCAVLNYDFQSGMAAFGDHLMANDMSWAYAEYKRMLKMLLHQRPAKRLVLKCPEHLWFLDALFDVFPDAAVVWTHRDPFGAVASYSSMMSMPRRVYYGSFDPMEVGPYVTERFAVGIERAMAARQRLPEANILDVRFADLVQDQAGTVRRIHEHFGLEHPDTLDDQVAAWLTSRREDKRGAHRYDPVRYGLQRDALRDRYADYMARYDIPSEG
jgi:hypothetical protein